ncbi:MAG TPA: STAS/SEC14 domain-containing protein [Candidatus Binatia bacterium]|nr:STAS/SEC14 domain-containing protein [Candidatus Binatia bacterium]
MITIRSETEGRTLVIEAAGKLTTKDYEEIFIPKLTELIQQHGKIKIVFYLNETFDGWELGAMWDDARFGLQHRNDFERIALVGGPRWVAWLTRLGSYFMHCELKTFEGASLKEAVDWVKR